MFKEISKTDINIRPFRVYKQWQFTENDILPIYGKSMTGSLFDPATDPQNTDGTYQRLIYHSVKTQFYNNPSTSSVVYETGNRISYSSTDERVISDNIAIISIPQIHFGEAIKPKSVTLIDGSSVYADDGYSNLVSASLIYGNVFYDKGMVILTSNVISGSTLSNYTINYRSTKTIYENEIFINILPSEFNVSTNPSSYYEDGGVTYVTTAYNPNDPLHTDRTTYQKKIYTPGVRHIRNTKYPYTSSYDPTKSGSFDDYQLKAEQDMTGSYLAPFITTIGLYDNDLNMVAVAKLPQPIKCLPEYPMNFIVRLDT